MRKYPCTQNEEQEQPSILPYLFGNLSPTGQLVACKFYRLERRLNVHIEDCKKQLDHGSAVNLENTIAKKDCSRKLYITNTILLYSTYRRTACHWYIEIEKNLG